MRAVRRLYLLERGEKGTEEEKNIFTIILRTISSEISSEINNILPKTLSEKLKVAMAFAGFLSSP